MTIFSGSHPLKIGSKVFTVTTFDSSDFEHKLLSICPSVENLDQRMGFIEYHRQEIYVRGDVHPDVTRECLMHEILHAILDDAGLAVLSGKDIDDLNEVIVSLVTPRFVAAMSDNFDFFSRLFSRANGHS